MSALRLLTVIVLVGAGAFPAVGVAAGGCEKLTVSALTASTDDGNVPANAIDGDFSTRWSGSGVGASITADLGSVRTVCSVSVAWYQGNLRQNYFVVALSSDGV